MESVRDKVVLITGASSGIGAATASLFAKYGSRLALTGRNTANLEKTAQDCCQRGLSRDKVLTILGDLANKDDIDKIMDQTIEKFRTIDILVNNAGIIKRATTEQLHLDDLEAVFQVNVKAPIQLVQLAMPYLKKSKGCIVNVSSGASTVSIPSGTAYCMSKAALDMFTSTLALELAPSGVRVNSVNPGHTRTPIHVTGGIAPPWDIEKYYAYCGKEHPTGRVALASEVANAIVYLASDAATYVSGIKMPVDGGYLRSSKL